MADVVYQWQPGKDITCKPSADVTGGRLVKISGVPSNGLPQVAASGAGERCFGVAARDRTAASGQGVLVLRNGVVPIEVGTNVVAGNEVESDATGLIRPLTTGKSVGVVLDTVAAGAGATAPVALNV